jgi:hypothetical protein
VFETIKMDCHGCKKKVTVFIKNPKYLNKNINRARNDNPIYPAFGTAKISEHSRGLLKGKCNRSGKVFRIKGKFVMEDIGRYDHFEWHVN